MQRAMFILPVNKDLAMKVTTMIRLMWPRDTSGYEIVEQPGDPAKTVLTGKGGLTSIVRKGGPLEEYEPLRMPAL